MEEQDYPAEHMKVLLSSTDPQKRKEGLVASCYYCLNNRTIDDYCRQSLLDEDNVVQDIAASAVAIRGLLDCLQVLVDRMNSPDWEIRMFYGDSVKNLLEHAADDFLFDIACKDTGWLAYIACIIMINRRAESEYIYHKFDKLTNDPSVVAVMRVPSEELRESWDRITKIN